MRKKKLLLNIVLFSCLKTIKLLTIPTEVDLTKFQCIRIKQEKPYEEIFLKIF